MRTFTNTDHTRILRAANDSRATPDEKNFLGMMASMAAANEPVEVDEYLRASALAAINMHLEESVFDRSK